MKWLSLLAVCALSSCGLFAPDVTPAVEGVQKMEQIFENQTTAFEALVDDPQNGMSSAVRAQYRAGIEQNLDAFSDVEGAVVDFLETVGDTDISIRANLGGKNR